MSDVGTVYLVGGGPGDPGLLTLRGAELLKRADFVLYDGLVNPLLLRHTSAYAERTARATRDGRRTLEQSEINARLISEARLGKMVVRLKGGDPFIFGRGSEEAEALAAAGIPFEVVPGITAATAAAEYAGISLTHREEASAVAFVTGHEDPTKENSSLDYKNLAGFSGTLVFYMGLHRLPVIVKSLIAAGKSPTTPAAVVSRGSTPLQRTVNATLEELPAAVAKAKLHAPSLIMIGSCVARRDAIRWFETKPLFGMSIGITRPIEQAENEVNKAISLGAQPVLMPMIQVRPIENWEEQDSVFERLSEYSVIVFTSLNGVDGFFQRLFERGDDVRKVAHCRFACIGPVTANRLRSYGVRADWVPETYRAEALAQLLVEHSVEEDRILWAQASRGRDVLPRLCKEAGRSLESLVVYHNEDVATLSEQALELLKRNGLSWIGISSPSIARRLAMLIPDEHRSKIGSSVKLVSISPITTAAAEEAGLEISVEAVDATWDGIFDAIRNAVLC